MIRIKNTFNSIIHKIPYTLLKRCVYIACFLTAMSFWGLDVLKKIHVCGISDFATTIDDLLFESNGVGEFHPSVKILLLLITIILIFLLAYKRYMRPKALVLKHSSFSKALSNYKKGLLSDYNVQEFDVDLVDQMNCGCIFEAVQSQDEIIKKIQSFHNGNTELIYYGIAHIPLIFRAGFQIGDEGKTRFFHKYRNRDAEFKEISSDRDDLNKYFGIQKSVNANESREMVMVVATSFPVAEQDLWVFHKRNVRCELKFGFREEAMYGVDSIESYDQMNRLRSEVMHEMRILVSKYGIERIHLILSTSSDFAFYLAESFSKYHDPEIITYQYDRNSAEKYPWGISNKASAKSAVIYNTITP